MWEWTITVGNVITLAVFLFSGAIAWTKITERSAVNSKDIEDNRKEAQQSLQTLREDMGERVKSIHARYDQHQGNIADSLQAIAIEMRAMHAENARFREHVAGTHPTREELGRLFQLLRDDLKEVARSGVARG